MIAHGLYAGNVLGEDGRRLALMAFQHSAQRSTFPSRTTTLMRCRGSTRPLNGVAGLLAKIASSAQPSAALRPWNRLTNGSCPSEVAKPLYEGAPSGMPTNKRLRENWSPTTRPSSTPKAAWCCYGEATRTLRTMSW
jgi:hypothetical protein